MKVLGIIAEYNPFHLGHEYHLKKSKQKTGSDYSIAVISGSFVQRGEPSFIDKWTKAKMAVDNGVDLVIELPFLFSVQSAERFAFGSVKLLDCLNIVDYIAFGSELGSMDNLKDISKVLAEEPDSFKLSLQKNLNQGLSFPLARSNALRDFFQHYPSYTNDPLDIDQILKMSNNILAIEYLKALYLLNSSIKPVTIKRIGSKYTDNKLENNIASATAIRNNIFQNGVTSIKNYVPLPTYDNLMQYISRYQEFNSLNNYSQVIHYLLSFYDEDHLKNIIDMETGLENRFIAKSTLHAQIDDLVQAIATKRYTHTRIQRILIHLMANLTKPLFNDLAEHFPAYIRVLATNKKGFFLLNKIKKHSQLPILTKFADYKNYDNIYLKKIVSLDKLATDLYFLGLNAASPYRNMDYYTSPYILKG